MAQLLVKLDGKNVALRGLSLHQKVAKITGSGAVIQNNVRHAVDSPMASIHDATTTMPKLARLNIGKKKLANIKLVF